MLPQDEAAFDEALAPAIHGLAQWQTHDHRTRTFTLYDSLPDSMRHDRTHSCDCSAATAAPSGRSSSTCTPSW
jgi:hypothetical protein